MRKVLAGIAFLIASGLEIFFLPPSSIWIVLVVCTGIAAGLGLVLTRILPVKLCIIISTAIGSFGFLYLTGSLDPINTTILATLLIALGIYLRP